MKESRFQTTEYYLAVTLLTLGEELVNIEKNTSPRAIFVFKQSPTLNKNIEEYRKGKILVEPQKLFMNHKLVKSRLYNNYQ
jgi:hypothetical protein